MRTFVACLFLVSCAYGAIKFNFQDMAPPVASVAGEGSGCGDCDSNTRCPFKSIETGLESNRDYKMNRTATRLMQAFTSSPAACEEFSTEFGSNGVFSATAVPDALPAKIVGRQDILAYCRARWWSRFDWVVAPPSFGRQYWGHFNQSLTTVAYFPFMVRNYTSTSAGNVTGNMCHAGEAQIAIEFNNNYLVTAFRFNVVAQSLTTALGNCRVGCPGAYWCPLPAPVVLP